MTRKKTAHSDEIPPSAFREPAHFQTANPADEEIANIIKYYLHAKSCNVRELAENIDNFGDNEELVKIPGDEEFTLPSAHANMLFLSGNDIEKAKKILGIAQEGDLYEPSLGLQSEIIPGRFHQAGSWEPRPRDIALLQVDITHGPALEKALDTILRDKEFWNFVSGKGYTRTLLSLNNNFLEQGVRTRPIFHPLNGNALYFYDETHPELTMEGVGEDHEAVQKWSAWMDDQRVEYLGKELLKRNLPSRQSEIWAHIQEMDLTDPVTAWLAQNDPKAQRPETAPDPKALAEAIHAGNIAKRSAQAHGAVHEKRVRDAMAEAEFMGPRRPIDHAERATDDAERAA
ncbi:MAG: hypothetical protein ACKVOE_03610 [Rickettsiales bacterium]